MGTRSRSVAPPSPAVSPPAKDRQLANIDNAIRDLWIRAESARRRDVDPTDLVCQMNVWLDRRKNHTTGLTPDERDVVVREEFEAHVADLVS